MHNASKWIKTATWFTSTSNKVPDEILLRQACEQTPKEYFSTCLKPKEVSLKKPSGIADKIAI
jgi:hypothetical protein